MFDVDARTDGIVNGREKVVINTGFIGARRGQELIREDKTETDAWQAPSRGRRRVCRGGVRREGGWVVSSLCLRVCV